MKIVFFGTSNVALPVLQTLVNHHEIAAVVTQPDAPVGRKQELSESPVSVLAEELQLKVLKPATLKDNTIVRMELQSIAADMFVVVAYGKIIPEDILSLPPHGTLNVHPSLLPKYRGASPIQNALLNGDTETGTSIMLVDKEMDHGPVLAQQKVSVDPDDNAITLGDKLARVSAKLLLDVIPQYISGSLSPQEQDHASATFTKIITKQDGAIDWNKPASEILNQFRAYYPWPGVWTTWNGKILKITDCTINSQGASGEPGTVLEGGIVVCGNGTSLFLNRVQLEGKNEMDIVSFLNGNGSMVGASLGK